MQNDVIFKLSNDLADVANQAAINREASIWKCRCKALDSLKDKGEAFCERATFWHCNFHIQLFL